MLQPNVPALILAPMEGVTDAPMRAVQGETGAFTFAVSEFLRVSQYVPSRTSFFRHVPELQHGGRTPTGLPVQVQILGGHAGRMGETAAMACAVGAAAVDINFGCPARTVNRHDGGATLLKHPERIREIYHEVLGCALLRAPMPSWFDDFRCGCMVLSDLGNRPQAIAAAADYFDIGDRIGHIARLGLEVDHHAEFWGKLAELFPRAAGPDQLPGISRLAIETRIWGGQRKVVTTWLRTSWRT